MAWIQGTKASQNFNNPPYAILTLNVTTGNTLILSIGIYSTNIGSTLGGLGSIIDNQGNIWQLAASSPVQGGIPSAQLLTFIALNCNGGVTTLDFSALDYAAFTASLDEYSNVSTTNALDDVNFQSIPFGTSPAILHVNSGNVLPTNNDLIYSAGFAASSVNLTASGGFTVRQSNSGNGVTLASFDYTGNSPVNNTITSNAPPVSLHVNLIALSPTPIVQLVAQKNYIAGSGIMGGSTTVPYKFNVTAGNLLILGCRVAERGHFQTTDTQNNSWTTIMCNNDVGPNSVLAFAIASLNGPNTVTLNGTTGGDDNECAGIILEYNVQGAVYTSTSQNSLSSGGSINTGALNVTVPSNQQLLLISDLAAFPQLGNPNVGISKVQSGYLSPYISSTWRDQVSDSGLFNEFPSTLVIADQMFSTSGNYSNTFVVSQPNFGLYTNQN